MEYFSFFLKNDNESVFLEVNGKYFKFFYLVFEIYWGYDGEGWLCLSLVKEKIRLFYKIEYWGGKFDFLDLDFFIRRVI